MFSDNSKIIVVLTGSIGGGKTSIALYSLCYIQYKLMLLKDPWKFFSLNPSGKMIIAFFNLNRSLSDSGGYSKMMSLMANSPWFRERAMRITGTKKGEVLDFPLIDYALASPLIRGFGVVGKEVVSAILDEVDSPMDPATQKLRVVEAYSAMFIRFQGRFAPNGYSLGKLFVVCSRQDENAFIDTFISERQHSGANDTLVYDPPIWDAKPEGTYPKETFPVYCGNQYAPPKVIEELDVERYKNAGGDVIRVPVNFKESFQTNIIRSMRDIAGRTVAGTHKYGLFPSESIISECFDVSKQDPVKLPIIYTGQKDTSDLINYLDLSKIRLSKSIPRYIHYDISFTTDHSGLSMAGISDWKLIESMNPDGTYKRDLAPIIETDFCMSIAALENDRIPPHKVRKLVLDLRAQGFNIAQFSADLQLASEETLQLLRSAGFKAEYFSVDKDSKGYFDFRNMVFDKRWICHKDSKLFFELKYLEVSPITGKVDHPKKVKDVEFLETGEIKDVVAIGSKDRADACVAAVVQCAYANERPMDAQIMVDAMKRANPVKQNIEEDISRLLKLQDNTGKEILGDKTQAQQIANVFKRLRK